MAIGMTYEQYWYGDPLMARAFYEAYQIKKDLVNDTAWLNGLYTFRALSATVGNLGKKRGSKPIEYPGEPIELKGRNKNAEHIVTEEERENERLRLVTRLNQVIQARKNTKDGV